MSKVLIILLGLLFISLNLGCSISGELVKPPNLGTTSQAIIAEPVIQHITNSTVALVVQTEEGWRPNCTGTWINATTILTANHCVEPDEVIGKKKPATVGQRVYYVVYNEVMGIKEEPNATHLAVVVASDHAHDLALVRVVGNSYPAHENASLGSVPAIGETVHLVGHTSGLYYSYQKGFVSAYRLRFPKEDVDKTGPFIQIQMPMWYGNSGSGVFNDRGELIGVASFIEPKIPNVGYLISVTSIKEFLLPLLGKRK